MKNKKFGALLGIWGCVLAIAGCNSTEFAGPDRDQRGDAGAGIIDEPGASPRPGPQDSDVIVRDGGGTGQGSSNQPPVPPQGPEAEGVSIEREFAATRIGSDTVKFVPAYGIVEQQVTMQAKPPVVAILRQVERPIREETFTQGNDGEWDTREFQVSSLARLDLLIVVDDSASMEDEQDGIKGKLRELTSGLQRVDWRIAVVTTSASTAFSCRVIDSADSDRQQAFEQAIDAGINGDSAEQGVLMAMRAFQTSPTSLCQRNGRPWWRDGSLIAVLFVSDEEDQSAPAATAAGLVSRLRSLRQPDALRSYALTWDRKRDNSCRYSDIFAKDETPGRIYESIVNGSSLGLGGLIQSICDTSKYAEILSAISADVAPKVKREFELPNVPELETVVITMVDDDGAERAFTNFAISGRRVTLNTVGDRDAKLKIVYRYNSVKKFEHVSLTHLPVVDSVRVWVGKQELPSDDFIVDAEAGKVRFVDMPPNNAKVRIQFRENRNLTREFSLDSLPMEGHPIEVKVGGHVVQGVTFHPSTRILVLPRAPIDGAEIKVSYRERGWRVLRYGAHAVSADDIANGVSATDAVTSEFVPMSIENGELVFAEEAFAVGRKIVVTYDYGNSTDILEHELAHDPIEDSVSVQLASGGAGCIEGVAVAGRMVSFRCNGSTLGEVAISYSYLAEINTAFTLPTDNPEAMQWQVWVDGQPVDFSREGNQITIDASLVKLGSKVRILARG